MFGCKPRGYWVSWCPWPCAGNDSWVSLDPHIWLRKLTSLPGCPGVASLRCVAGSSFSERAESPWPHIVDHMPRVQDSPGNWHKGKACPFELHPWVLTPALPFISFGKINKLWEASVFWPAKWKYQFLPDAPSVRTKREHLCMCKVLAYSLPFIRRCRWEISAPWRLKGADGAEEGAGILGSPPLFLGPHVHSAEGGRKKASSGCTKKAQFLWGQVNYWIPGKRCPLGIPNLKQTDPYPSFRNSFLKSLCPQRLQFSNWHFSASSQHSRSPDE